MSSAGRSPTIRRKRHGLSVPLSAQSCTSWAGHLPGMAQYFPTATDHPYAEVMNKASKSVLSGTLKTTDWANSTILSGDTTEEIEKRIPSRSSVGADWAAMASIRLPEPVCAAVAVLGPAGQRWLAGLPELVSSLERTGG